MVKEAGVWPGVKVRHVVAVTLYRGSKQRSLGPNITLKPQLKGNIWREGLYNSHSKSRRVRDTHRER